MEKNTEGKSGLRKMLVNAVLLIAILVLGFGTGFICWDDIAAMLSVRGTSILQLAVMMVGVLLIVTIHS